METRDYLKLAAGVRTVKAQEKQADALEAQAKAAAESSAQIAKQARSAIELNELKKKQIELQMQQETVFKLAKSLLMEFVQRAKVESLDLNDPKSVLSILKTNRDLTEQYSKIRTPLLEHGDETLLDKLDWVRGKYEESIKRILSSNYGEDIKNIKSIFNEIRSNDQKISEAEYKVENLRSNSKLKKHIDINKNIEKATQEGFLTSEKLGFDKSSYMKMLENNINPPKSSLIKTIFRRLILTILALFTVIFLQIASTENDYAGYLVASIIFAALFYLAFSKFFKKNALIRKLSLNLSRVQKMRQDSAASMSNADEIEMAINETNLTINDLKAKNEILNTRMNEFSHLDDDFIRLVINV